MCEKNENFTDMFSDFNLEDYFSHPMELDLSRVREVKLLKSEGEVNEYLGSKWTLLSILKEHRMDGEIFTGAFVVGWIIDSKPVHPDKNIERPRVGF